MKKKVIQTKKVAPAIGPYVQGLRVGNLLFTSGQMSFNSNGEMVQGDIRVQTKQALENLKAILEEGGVTLRDVVKVTVYLSNIEDFGKMNEVYAEYFGENKPARACVEVSRLVKDLKVEIEAIAVLDNAG